MTNLINITDFADNKFLSQNLDDRDIDPDNHGGARVRH
jgi:hypothetical protein